VILHPSDCLARYTEMSPLLPALRATAAPLTGLREEAFDFLFSPQQTQQKKILPLSSPQRLPLSGLPSASLPITRGIMGSFRSNRPMGDFFPKYEKNPSLCPSTCLRQVSPLTLRNVSMAFRLSFSFPSPLRAKPIIPPSQASSPRSFSPNVRGIGSRFPPPSSLSYKRKLSSLPSFFSAQEDDLLSVSVLVIHSYCNE